MPVVGRDVVIKITGTKKSLALDPGEIHTLHFSRTEKLRDDFNDVNDLLGHILNTAFMSGDAIFELLIDGDDLVRTTVVNIINECGMDLNAALPEVCALPFLSNADPADVYELMEISMP